MSVDLASEVWAELKRYVNKVDRDEAAEAMVAVLIDNDVLADEIKEAFKGDSEVRGALAHYLKDHQDDDDDEDDYNEEEYDDDY